MNEIQKMTEEIVEVFKDFLSDRGIVFKCKDSKDEEHRIIESDGASLYGSEYWRLNVAVADILIKNYRRDGK